MFLALHPCYSLSLWLQSACVTNHCKNNGNCQSGFTDKGYRCLCSAGYKGSNCGQGKQYSLYIEYISIECTSMEYESIVDTSKHNHCWKRKFVSGACLFLFLKRRRSSRGHFLNSCCNNSFNVHRCRVFWGPAHSFFIRKR